MADGLWWAEGSPAADASAAGVAEVCRRLRAEAPRLAGLPADALLDACAAAVASTAAAVEADPARFSPDLDADLARWGHRATFDALGREALAAWRDRELGGALDGWVPAGPGRQARAFGPSLLVQVQASNVAASAVEGMLAAVLLRAPLLAKAPSTGLTPALTFARALADADPRLGRAVAVASWPGGAVELEAPALAAAEALLIHGGDDAVASLQRRVDPLCRLVAHPHRFSLTYLTRPATDAPVEALLRDAFAWDQRGCLSSRLVYVEGDVDETRALAVRLAAAAGPFSRRHPRGPQPLPLLAAHAQLRGRLDFTGEAFVGPDHLIGVDHGPFELPPDGRCLLLRAVPSVEAALAELGSLGRRLQGVAIHGPAAAREAAADAFARAGAAWICAPGDLQRPPTGWPADGLLPLVSLVRWAHRAA